MPGRRLDYLVSDEHAAELAALIRTDRSLPDLFTLRHEADQVNSTTQVTVVDSLGNAFATAPSNTLAMSLIVPELGVSCQAGGYRAAPIPIIRLSGSGPTSPYHPVARNRHRRRWNGVAYYLPGW